MMFEITRLCAREMAELLLAGGPVGLFRLEAGMTYDSAKATGDDGPDLVKQEQAKLTGQICTLTGRWDIVSKAARLATDIAWQTELWWVPNGETVAERAPVTGLKQIPVTITETKSRGYQGD